MKGAFYTGQYRNVFAELGHSQEEIAQKLKDAFHTVFYGPDDEKFYFEAGDDMGYFEDTGNFDARTEGMSYAMMMCVQMDMKNEFDRVWKWARTYMYMEDGYNKGYLKNTFDKLNIFSLVEFEKIVCYNYFEKRRYSSGNKTNPLRGDSSEGVLPILCSWESTGYFSSLLSNHLMM